MSNRTDQSSKQPGLAPGTLIHVGEQKTSAPRIRLIHFTPQQFEHQKLDSLRDLDPFLVEPHNWLNVDGLHDIELVRNIGAHFAVTDLTLEDVLNTRHRPKLDEEEDYLFVVLRMLQFEEDAVQSEQFSLVLKSGCLITFQERPGDMFDPVRDRIKNTRWRSRQLGCDYLFYALIDAVIDHYFVVIEQLAEKVDALESRVIDDTESISVKDLFALRREFINVRKAVWPVRELLNGLLRSESELICDETRTYIRDVQDHVLQIIDRADEHSEMVNGLHDTYQALLSHKMNSVMKVLTIVATIFIPLTFIAGIYGMNFQNMPELTWSWSYPLVWGLMISITVGMLLYFRKKDWI